MVEARHLTKRYGPKVAVDAVSFDVRPGSVTGFLGPDGSGKSIAYFCATELLANAAKHSCADAISLRPAGPRDRLLLTVADNGTGGADPTRGTGLSGLAQRIAVVDGRLAITSPPGGPTTITVEIPLRP